MNISDSKPAEICSSAETKKAIDLVAIIYIIGPTGKVHYNTCP